MQRRSPFDLRYKVLTFTPAEVRAFHSAPKTFLSGVPGSVVVPRYLLLQLDAGPIYNLGGQQLLLSYTNLSGTGALQTGPPLALGVSAANAAVYEGFITLTSCGVDSDPSAIAGKSVVTNWSSGTDVTGGEGRNVTFVLAYYVFPVTRARFATLTDAFTGLAS